MYNDDVNIKSKGEKFRARQCSHDSNHARFLRSNVATGLAEFQTGEFIPLSHGGIGAALTIGSAGQVLSSDGTDTAWVNAGSLTAGAAAEVGVNQTNTTDSTHFPVFVEASSGNEEVRVDTGFTYNPITGNITATSFSGACRF